MAVTNEQYILYGHAACPSCSTLKSFFKGNEINYEYVDIRTEKGMMAYERDFPGARSVPRIVVLDEYDDGDGNITHTEKAKLEGAKQIMDYFK